MACWQDTRVTESTSLGVPWRPRRLGGEKRLVAGGSAHTYARSEGGQRGRCGRRGGRAASGDDELPAERGALVDRVLRRQPGDRLAALPAPGAAAHTGRLRPD